MVILRISRNNPAVPGSNAEAASFMKLSLMPTSVSRPPIAPEAAPAGAVDRGMIEIEFATGARMRITGAVDASALAAAVAVLAEGRRR